MILFRCILHVNMHMAVKVNGYQTDMQVRVKILSGPPYLHSEV